MAGALGFIAGMAANNNKGAANSNGLMDSMLNGSNQEDDTTGTGNNFNYGTALQKSLNSNMNTTEN